MPLPAALGRAVLLGKEARQATVRKEALRFIEITTNNQTIANEHPVKRFERLDLLPLVRGTIRHVHAECGNGASWHVHGRTCNEVRPRSRALNGRSLDRVPARDDVAVAHVLRGAAEVPTGKFT